MICHHVRGLVRRGGQEFDILNQVKVAEGQQKATVRLAVHLAQNATLNVPREPCDSISEASR